MENLIIIGIIALILGLAMEARARADVQIDTAIIPAYEKWLYRAKEDPVWAKENPFRIVAKKDLDHNFSIQCYPLLD